MLLEIPNEDKAYGKLRLVKWDPNATGNVIIPDAVEIERKKATVNETTGVVTGVASGDVTITVTYKNYQNVEVTETTTVTVKSVIIPPVSNM